MAQTYLECRMKQSTDTAAHPALTRALAQSHTGSYATPIDSVSLAVLCVCARMWCTAVWCWWWWCGCAGGVVVG